MLLVYLLFYATAGFICMINQMEGFFFKLILNNIERIVCVYDAFLSEFPLCYCCWNKYAAYHRPRLCPMVEFFEPAESNQLRILLVSGLITVALACLSFED